MIVIKVVFFSTQYETTFYQVLTNFHEADKIGKLSLL